MERQANNNNKKKTGSNIDEERPPASRRMKRIFVNSAYKKHASLLLNKKSVNSVKEEEQQLPVEDGFRSYQDKKDEEEEDNDSGILVAKFDSLSLGTSRASSSGIGTGSSPTTTTNVGGEEGWRVWHFECPDIPENCPRCKKSRSGSNTDEQINLKDGKSTRQKRPPKPNCLVCAVNDQMRRVVGSNKRWEDCLKRGENILPEEILSPEKLLSILKWPSELAKDVRVNKKLGIALFRDGIVPDCEHSTCQGGGYFSMATLHTTTGNSFQLAQLDLLLLHSFAPLALHKLPEHLKREVSGIFVRASAADLGRNNSNVPGDFLCKFSAELWIRDQQRKEEFWPALNAWCAAERLEMRRFLAAPKEDSEKEEEAAFFEFKRK